MLLFDTDHVTKMLPRWMGPFTVLGRERQHSYRIQTEEGKTAVAHANRLRPYYAQVSHVGVVFDEDREFGEVEYTPRAFPACGSEILTREKLSHLDAKKPDEVTLVFEKHSGVFAGKPGMAKTGQH